MREDHELVFVDYLFTEALVSKIKEEGFPIHTESFYKDMKVFVGINKGELGDFVNKVYPYLAGSSITILQGHYVILIGAEPKEHDFIYSKG